MQNSEGTGRDPAPPESSGDSEKTPEVGPLGRTRSEDQRRRLIIAGLSTPGLMTLPSRRVWAAKCSKSKLMSGNLSANKKKGGGKLDNCGALGCKSTYWKDDKAYKYEDWSGMFFDDLLGSDVYKDTGDITMIQVLGGEEPDDDTSSWASRRFTAKGADDVPGELKKAAKQFAGGYLNADYIDNPDPNHIWNFELDVGDVKTLWDDNSFDDTRPSPDLFDPEDDNFDAAEATKPANSPTPPTSYTLQTSVVAAALEAGYWAKWYAIFKEAKDTREDAAEDAYKFYRDQIAHGDPNFADTMDDINQYNKVCPF